MYRTCKKCEKTFPLESFPSARKKPDGGKWHRRFCSQCYYKHKNHTRDRNKIWLTNFKENLKCERCGYSKKSHPETFVIQALQFHHKEKNKTFAISDGVQRGMSIERIKKEISKCEVLCSRCHAETHYPSRGNK